MDIEKQFDNPLRSRRKAAQRAVPPAAPSTNKETVAIATPEPPPRVSVSAPVPSRDAGQSYDPDVQKMINELKSRGIDVKGPKINYVKRSFEIEEELLVRFEKQYPRRGYRLVKDAVNAAMRHWLDNPPSE